MRKAILLALIGLLSVSNLGCIMVIGVKDLPEHKQVIEIDGELYVIDTRSQKACKVCAEEVTQDRAGETEAEAKGE